MSISQEQSSLLSSRMVLQQEYSKRFEKNPRYSLRAFARAIGISHTVLSLVINGKRPLSKKAAIKVADSLCMDPVSQRQFLERRNELRLSLLDAESYVGTAKRELLSLDQFNLISEWQHYAILSLLEISGSRYEARWIGKRLGISETQAKIAMERLERLGMVKKMRNGRWRQVSQPIQIENDISTAATRKFQIKLIEKALQSLEGDPISIRDCSSITFAMNPEDLAWAKDKIRGFRRSLCQELEKRGSSKEVYNLTVQLYPVSKAVSGESK